MASSSALQVNAMPKSRSRRVPSTFSPAAFRDIVRRLDALERRVGGGRPRHGHSSPAKSDILRKWDIVAEHNLRRDIAHDETLARDQPETWRRLEAQRLTRNRERATLNRRLRLEGLPLVALEPSLKRRAQQLKQLEATNRATKRSQ